MFRAFLRLFPVGTLLLLLLLRVELPLEVKHPVPRLQTLVPVELLDLGDQLGEILGLVPVQRDLFEGPDDDPDVVDVSEVEAAADIALFDVEDDPAERSTVSPISDLELQKLKVVLSFPI